MTELEPILGAITEDAKNMAEKIKTDGENLAEQLKRQALSESERIRDEFEKKITAEIEEIHFAKNAELADVEKIAKMHAKAEAVATVKREALKRISNLLDEEYCEFIKKLVKKAELSKVSVVYLNERDKKRLPEKMFLPAKVADGVIESLGGFKAFGEKADFDFTIEAIFEEKNTEICDAVNRIYQRENGI